MISWRGQRIRSCTLIRSRASLRRTVGTTPTCTAFLLRRRREKLSTSVKNVAGQNGGEAWKKLCRRFSGKTRGKRLHLIRRCVNPMRVKKLNEVTGMVERWEMNIRRLEADFKEVFSNGLTSGFSGKNGAQ